MKLKNDNISALNLSLYIIGGIAIFSLVIAFVTTIYTKSNDKVDTSNSNENKEQLKDNTTNNKDNNCVANATNGSEFIEKITNLKNNCINYQVSYKNLKYTTEKKDNYYINKIYYKDNEIKYVNTDSLVYSELLQIYMLDSNTFLFTFFEVPALQDNAYYAIVFSEDGKIKFSAEQIDDVSFEEYTNKLSFKITKMNLPSIVGNLCEHITNYNQDDVVEESYTYKYSNNEMNLEDLKKVTIADINNKYNCK